MTKYAKIVNGKIEFAPINYVTDEVTIFNFGFNEELMLEYGFKPFIEAQKPQIKRKYHIEYTETSESITENIIFDETQEEAKTRELLIAKNTKYKTALDLAKDYEQNGTVSYKNCVFEMSTSNRNNLRDTEEALIELGQESTMWSDANDTLVELSVEDLKYIRLNLILSRIQTLWIEQFSHFKELIENAQTAEEVENIVINYNLLNTESEGESET